MIGTCRRLWSRISSGGQSAPKLETVDAAKQAWAIALHIRERANWRIHGASLCRFWKLRLDGVSYRIEGSATAFFDDQPWEPQFTAADVVRMAERTSDALWSANAPEFYTLLVDERGWTPEELATWLADAWALLLLAKE